MADKPIIMIAWGACLDQQFAAPGMMLMKAYDWAIADNGGIPMVPLSHHQVHDYCSIADGLLLPGGMNYSPVRGQNAFLDQEERARKEAFVSDLYQEFKMAKKPILGICEGYQKINCEEGGTLNLDLAKTWHVTHFLTAHEVYTQPGSLIRKIWGEKFVANSYHEYAIDKLGKDLEVTGRSPEGVPEAIEHTSLPIYGVQFHPERMRGEMVFPAEGADGDKLFAFFISKCKENHNL